MVDRSISGSGGMGKMSQSEQDAFNEEAFKAYNEKALEKCVNCGRTFLPDRLVVHYKSCKTPKVK